MEAERGGAVIHLLRHCQFLGAATPLTVEELIVEDKEPLSKVGFLDAQEEAVSSELLGTNTKVSLVEELSVPSSSASFISGEATQTMQDSNHLVANTEEAPGDKKEHWETAFYRDSFSTLDFLLWCGWFLLPCIVAYPTLPDKK
ncbi:hypothetical protein QOT17_009382 [Balamuthia mandrillaris]